MTARLTSRAKHGLDVLSRSLTSLSYFHSSLRHYGSNQVGTLSLSARLLQPLEIPELITPSNYDDMAPRIPQGMPDLLRHLELGQTGQEVDASEKPIFLSIDLEAFEFAQNKITEIGISVFDTRNCIDPPGANATSWLKKIMTRHLIIREYKRLVNKRFLKGCPDKFNFGVSELVPLKDVPAILADVLTNPISELSSTPRNIVVVGHGLKNDTGYLQNLGFSLDTYSNVIHKMDTQTLAGGKRAQVGLEKLLLALGIQAENLHNAGNDAAYTLQALLLIGYQHNADPNALQQAILSTPNPVKFKHRHQHKHNAEASGKIAGVNLGTAISAPARSAAPDQPLLNPELEMRDVLTTNPVPASAVNNPSNLIPQATPSRTQKRQQANQFRQASGNGSISSPGEASGTRPAVHDSKVEKSSKQNRKKRGLAADQRAQRSLEHHGGVKPAPMLTRAKRDAVKAAAADTEKSKLVAGDDEFRLSFRPQPPSRRW